MEVKDKKAIKSDVLEGVHLGGPLPWVAAKGIGDRDIAQGAVSTMAG
jgi:hypothetical protein